MMILRNENKAINSIYVSGDGVDFELGKDVRMAFEILIMIYYTFDLAYPKCHQLLGFLQIALFKDEAPFHRGANFIKFEKKYQNFKPVV